MFKGDNPCVTVITGVICISKHTGYRESFRFLEVRIKAYDRLMQLKKLNKNKLFCYDNDDRGVPSRGGGGGGSWPFPPPPHENLIYIYI